MNSAELTNLADRVSFWLSSKKARLDTLRSGTPFVCISGEIWKKGREYKTTGAYYATRLVDGKEDMFCGSADVAVLG